MGLLRLITITLVFITIDSHACNCPTKSIDKDADKAYDIIVGRVISASPEKLECTEYGPDVAFEFEVEFSFKGKTSDRITIFGGSGGGSCGGILHKNHDYLVVVHKCDSGLYTTMCSDNIFLKNASTQIEFLNGYFSKDYKIATFSFLTETVFLVLGILAGAGRITFNYYKNARTRKN